MSFGFRKPVLPLFLHVNFIFFSMNFWLMKSEPAKYSWPQLQKDGKTLWDGVRNYQARNYMRQMEVGDLAVFYHSNEDKAAMGIARVVSPAYADPTAKEGDWSVVDVAPHQALPRPVTLDEMRQHPVLRNMNMFRQNRLSITQLTQEEFDLICALGQAGKTMV